MNKITLFMAILYLSSNIKSKQMKCRHSEWGYSSQKSDTAFLLAGYKKKSWDRVGIGESKSQSRVNDFLGWEFSRNHELKEYQYVNKKKQYKILYQSDLLLDHWEYKVNMDTIYLSGLEDLKYLIKKITKDSLIVQSINGQNVPQKIVIFRAAIR